MPSWEFLGKDNILKLTAYMQAEGVKNADRRVTRQQYWKKPSIKAFETGPDKNIEWLHSNVPAVWRAMPNPYPATRSRSPSRQKRCISSSASAVMGPSAMEKGRRKNI